MAYGTIKVDNITYTNAGSDTTVTVSGLATGSGFSNLTVTGTISGATITGNVGEFTTLTAGVATLTSGVFASGTASAPSVSFIGDSNTGLYSPGADQVAISTNGTGRLFVDSSGRVGVGIASPSYGLHVRNGGGNSESVLAQYGAGTAFFVGAYANEARIENFNNASGFLTFRTNSSERLRITSDGKLGLGTSSPSKVLTIESATQYQGVLLKNASNSVAELVGLSGANDNGALILKNAGTTQVNIAASGATYFNGGNVGIGVTSPSSNLTVGGNPPTSGAIAAVGSAAGIALALSDNTNSSLYVRTASGGAIIGTDFGNNLRFATSGNNASDEKARIDSSGRLLIGTSSAYSVNGTDGWQLQIAGTGAVGPAYSRFSDNANPARINFFKSRATSLGGFTVVQTNDDLGGISFLGADGTAAVVGAEIKAAVDGTPGSNDMPGRLVFSTTADGASSPTERLRISQDGVVTIKNGAVAEIDTLADGATITPDLSASCNFTVTISGNRTLANPSNITAGQTGSIFIVQGTGSNTLSWGSYWDFPAGTAPTLSTASGAVDRVDYIVRTSTSIHTVFTANYS